jgi:N-acetyl-anhydromuramyl-L-alanine amidase AmpD
MKSIYKIIFALCLFYFNFALAFECDNERPIFQKPINFNNDRVQLSLDYLRTHYGIIADSIEIKPKMIVLHWTAYNTFKESYDAFYPPRLKLNDRGDISQQSELNVSAHYLIDRGGEIYQLMPDHWLARHVIGLNYYAIGIENVGGANHQQDLTEEQIKSNAYLICYLKNKYPDIHYLIGHFEYTKFKNNRSLWLERDKSYQTDKNDPGVIFLERVRELTKELGLLGAEGEPEN